MDERCTITDEMVFFLTTNICLVNLIDHGSCVESRMRTIARRMMMMMNIAIRRNQRMITRRLLRIHLLPLPQLLVSRTFTLPPTRCIVGNAPSLVQTDSLAHATVPLLTTRAPSVYSHSLNEPTSPPRINV